MRREDKDRCYGVWGVGCIRGGGGRRVMIRSRSVGVREISDGALSDYPGRSEEEGVGDGIGSKEKERGER